MPVEVKIELHKELIPAVPGVFPTLGSVFGSVDADPVDWLPDTVDSDGIAEHGYVEVII